MATADADPIAAEQPRVPAEPRKEPEVNKLFRMVMKHEGSDLQVQVAALVLHDHAEELVDFRLLARLGRHTRLFGGDRVGVSSCHVWFTPSSEAADAIRVPFSRSPRH